MRGRDAVLYHDPPPPLQVLQAERLKRFERGKLSSNRPLVGAVTQKAASKPVNRQSVGWVASESSLLFMKDGGINIKEYLEGTHKDGTQEQCSPWRVIVVGVSRREGTQGHQHDGGGGEGVPRRVIVVGVK